MAIRSKRTVKKPAKYGGRPVKRFAAPREFGSLMVWAASGRLYIIPPDELTKFDQTANFRNPSGQAFLKSLPVLENVRKALIIKLQVIYDGV